MFSSNKKALTINNFLHMSANERRKWIMFVSAEAKNLIDSNRIPWGVKLVSSKEMAKLA